MLNFLSTERLQALKYLTTQIAISIKNARLHADQKVLIEELETENAELECFTYTIFHNLKIPLITIRDFLD